MGDFWNDFLAAEGILKKVIRSFFFSFLLEYVSHEVCLNASNSMKNYDKLPKFGNFFIINLYNAAVKLNRISEPLALLNKFNFPK